MSESLFTKQEGRRTKDVVLELFDALPKRKSTEYIGHLNDILLFIEAATRAAPDEQPTPKTD